MNRYAPVLWAFLFGICLVWLLWSVYGIAS
jgi:hypothetical protein